LTERGREVRVVNPLWTSRQRAFWRSIAAVVLRRHRELPLATEFGEVPQAVREAERSLQDLDKARTRSANRLHLQLSATYTAVYEEFSESCEARLRCASSVASRSHKIWPATMVEMLASLLLELAGGKVGPHKGADLGGASEGK